MGFPSSNKDRLGREGEVVVRKWLLEQGYMILEASLINTGTAPMLKGKLESQNLILPDCLTWKEGEPTWIEIKTKSYATQRKFPQQGFPDCAGRWEHGLPERHWKNYCIIQEVTRIPVSLAVLELDRKMLFVSRLDSLRKGVRIAFMQTENHVFFNLQDTKNLSDFDKWYRLEDDWSLPDSIEPLAWRTTAQSNKPLIRQMTLGEYNLTWLRNQQSKEGAKNRDE